MAVNSALVIIIAVFSHKGFLGCFAVPPIRPPSPPSLGVIIVYPLQTNTRPYIYCLVLTSFFDTPLPSGVTHWRR